MKENWLDECKDMMFRLDSKTRDLYKSKKRTLQENIDFYRDKLRYALTENEDVMKRFYNIKTNHCKPMLIEKITLDRIINKHGDNGLINISAWRSSLDNETNTQNTNRLIKDLQNSGYRYLPGYGGYRDTKMGEESDFEPSFNVFNYNTNGEPQDFEKLKQFGIELAKKYDQSSVLVKAPNEVPMWFNGDGERVSKDETNKVFKNDAQQPYFTSLKTPEELANDTERQLKDKYIRYCKDKGIKADMRQPYDDFKKDHLKDVSPSRRYTYDMKGIWDECYVNPSPCDLNERRMRTIKGEILVDLELV